MSLDAAITRKRQHELRTRAEVADGLLGLAQALDREAKRLRKDAASVRKGELIPHFAASYGRNTKYTIERTINVELPETLAVWPEVQS